MEEYVLIDINQYVKLQVFTPGDPNVELVKFQTREFRDWLRSIGLFPGNRRLTYKYFQQLPSYRNIPIEKGFRQFRQWNEKLIELHKDYDT